MAVAPQFALHRLPGGPASRHSIELYIDFVCPFSKKQLLGVRDNLLPILPKDVAVIIRQVPQPWHAASTLVHEAAIAVSKLVDDAQTFWQFAYALMEHQEEYFDEAVENETLAQIRRRLAKLAHDSVGVEESAFLDLVKTGQGNSGNKVGADLKLQVKLGRQNGIHVTPTVLLDGLVDPSVSSSFGKDEWAKYVKEKLS
ncbi:uncharacterized protein L969DRAFT_105569 [Mixia osmundae IAM 14324]|uniref:Uncharacterized protein n=1 Tax=Mixia osmundae (strain CBS 9802 / IAM 14324 / JCM 22182 / KY 12970) TaxID=764103 RepID=G7E2E3_MIXOS|nr:uncharacterized protein L969DRAFT_105569 [Mixia osmundae IAM 14324]KEI36874.1 hypothetical protein L969DRAFT_105569 [Mixia osmundae IAM 14324]GAA97003.1 hypothetical protein E5Q_03677 [Mixia osmundae IAM 14324]